MYVNWVRSRRHALLGLALLGGSVEWLGSLLGRRALHSWACARAVGLQRVRAARLRSGRLLDYVKQFWTSATRGQVVGLRGRRVFLAADGSAIVQQNKGYINGRGMNGMYHVEGTYNGRQYVLGISFGWVGQFYPELSNMPWR